MPREKVVLITHKNNRRNIPKVEAAAMLKHKQAELVSVHPPQIRSLRAPIYSEEQHHLAGYLVTGATSPTWNQASSSASHVRIKPRRSRFSQVYLELRAIASAERKRLEA